MQAHEQETERLLAAAGKAETDLRAQLAAQHRQEELASILAAARAKASGGRTGASSGGGRAGQIIVSGSWVCPVQGPVSFTDTFGSPRGGGRTHKGNDMFSPGGTPLVAVTDGSVFFQSDPLGGTAAYVNGRDGNTYYYAHLSDYVGGGRSVQRGRADRSRRQHRRRLRRPDAPALRDPPGRPERPRDRSVPHVGRSLRVTTGRVGAPIVRAFER